MKPETWASLRRLLAMALVPVFAMVQRKWGVDVSESTLLILDGIVAAGSAFYIAASNWKEVQKGRTEASVTTAVAALPAPAPTFVVETGAVAKPSTLDPIKTVTP
jgi:hypothetical protein